MNPSFHVSLFVAGKKPLLAFPFSSRDRNPNSLFDQSPTQFSSDHSKSSNSRTLILQCLETSSESLISPIDRPQTPPSVFIRSSKIPKLSSLNPSIPPKLHLKRRIPLTIGPGLRSGFRLRCSEIFHESFGLLA